MFSIPGYIALLEAHKLEGTGHFYPKLDFPTSSPFSPHPPPPLFLWRGRGSQVSQVGLELLIHRPLSAGITGERHGTRYDAVLCMETRDSEHARQALYRDTMHPQLKFPLKVYVNFWPFKSLPHPTPVPFNSPHFLSPHLQFAFASLGEFLQSSPRVLLQPPPFPPQRDSSFAFPCPRAVSLSPPRHISAAGDLPQPRPMPGFSPLASRAPCRFPSPQTHFSRDPLTGGRSRWCRRSCPR